MPVSTVGPWGGTGGDLTAELEGLWVTTERDLTPLQTSEGS